MTTGTQIAVIPAGFQLPAHLQTAEAAAAIAAYNAAAAGGIKTGGFPRISIKGSKFHIVKGGETVTITAPAQPGQPALPLMILESVIVAANPALSKTYYEGEYQPGDDKEPTCSSDNGITPDEHIVKPQSAACANCPQNQWGSKISKSSGKDVKACSDNKRLVLLPAKDLDYEALALNVTPSSLTDWGKYVKALSGRNIPINAIVTNITFDQTAAHPKLLFSFNRVLTAEEYAKVQERSKGDDVQNIVSPVRQVTTQPAAVAAAPAVQAPPVVVAPAAAAPATGGFGGTQPTADAPKRTRAQRKPPEAAQTAAQAAAATTAAQVGQVAKDVAQAVQQTIKGDPLAHLPPEVRSTVNFLGADSELGRALIAKYPAPVVSAPAATGGFGSSAAPEVATTEAALATANSLKDKLAARLRQGQGAAAAGK